MREIGRGAASVIYLAQEPKTKQIWSLKHVEKEAPKDQRFLDQAEREFQIANKLNHPNIRKIVRILKKKERLLSVRDLWLVMEFVDGAAMDVERPTRFETACEIFEMVAESLDYMHKQGFAHADMKPNNIVVAYDERGNVISVKVIDLGQSCEVGTVKERIQGTPDYIAPEQVHRRPITPATDVYNLGATMYWTFTARHVPTALAKGDSLVGSLDDHLIEKPTPPAQINPKVPELLDKLIMRCVEIVPENRPNILDVRDQLNLIRGKLLAARQSSGSAPGITQQQPAPSTSATQTG